MTVNQICRLQQVYKSYPLQGGIQRIFSNLTLSLPLKALQCCWAKAAAVKLPCCSLACMFGTAGAGRINFCGTEALYAQNGYGVSGKQALPWLTVAQNIYAEPQ